MIHDSYHCLKNPPGTSFPFPTRRSDDGSAPNFIGSNKFISRIPFTNEDNKCPVECRPTDHKDWEFC